VGGYGNCLGSGLVTGDVCRLKDAAEQADRQKEKAILRRGYRFFDCSSFPAAAM